MRPPEPPGRARRYWARMHDLTPSFDRVVAGDHPAFPAPENPDARIWRYLDFPKFVWLLDSSRLAMPHCRMMEDPFEGSTPQALIAGLEARAKEADPAERARIGQHLARLRKLAADFQRGYFISSWHMNDVESEAMWKLFSASNDGVALVSTFRRLRGALPRHVGVGLVRYIDYSRESLPSLDMFQWIMHKRLSFAHEREVCAVASLHMPDELGGAAIRQASDECGYYPEVDVAGLVEAVHVHPLAQAWFVNLVARIVARFGYDIPVRRSELTAKPLF